MNETRTQAERDAEYEREREAAQEDGTSLPERTDDMPPRNLFHAAQALASKLEVLPGGKEASQELDLALGAPALWGMLDVERAASLFRERFASEWPELAARFPWLDTAAESGESDAVGAMASHF